MTVGSSDTSRGRVLEAIRSAAAPLDDDELTAASGVEPRQTVNSICHALEDEGVIERVTGSEGKIVNRLVGESAAAGMLDVAVPDADPSADPELSAAAARAQEDAEARMLLVLSGRLGLPLRPKRLSHPSGAHVEVDGASEDNAVLVECWAHQGAPKIAQKYKLVNDAVKLHWIARALTPMPRRLILCVSDPAAVAHLRGRSWQGRAIADLGVEIEVIPLPAATPTGQ